MTTHGATELDMDTRELTLNSYDVKYIMAGKNGTWVKFHDGDKVQINDNADVVLLRGGQSPVRVRSNGYVQVEVHQINPGVFAALVIAFSLLITRWIK